MPSGDKLIGLAHGPHDDRLNERAPALPDALIGDARIGGDRVGIERPEAVTGIDVGNGDGLRGHTGLARS